MILKLGMKHKGKELYKVYINHDPGMTLTYFTAGQLWSSIHLNGENCQNVIGRAKLAENGQMDLRYMILEKFGPQGSVCPHPGAMYMYITIIFKDLR